MAQQAKNPFAQVPPKSHFVEEFKQTPGMNESEPMDPNRATYVQAPKDQPLGLNLDNFINEAEIKEKKDLEIINEIMEQHTTLVGVVSRRMSSIKVILNWWNKGNFTSALNALNMMNDMSVIMDVINHTFADNQKMDVLNYDHIA